MTVFQIGLFVSTQFTLYHFKLDQFSLFHFINSFKTQLVRDVCVKRLHFYTRYQMWIDGWWWCVHSMLWTTQINLFELWNIEYRNVIAILNTWCGHFIIIWCQYTFCDVFLYWSISTYRNVGNFFTAHDCVWLLQMIVSLVSKLSKATITLITQKVNRTQIFKCDACVLYRESK